MDNGAEATRSRFTRLKQEYEISIDFLPPADKRTLKNFVLNIVKGGAGNFFFKDDRDPTNVVELNVRFSVLPQYLLTDAQNPPGTLAQNCTFTIREM
jgi:hypothetical protein